MPSIDALQLVKPELDDLIATGNEVLADAAVASSGIEGAALAKVMAWVTRADHIIRKIAVNDSAYHAAFATARSTSDFSCIHSNRYAQLAEIQGALQGLSHAVDKGHLQDLRRLLQAEIFADFLEMAEHLLSEGYKDAAAVLLGGVLEDALRKLAQDKGLPLTNSNGKPLTIDPLNVSLAKAGVYEMLTQKQITTWAQLRNHASHGEYDKYTAAEVKEMFLFVQRFCAAFMQ